MPPVLHVPYTYFPEPCGGTEVYVRSLCNHLAAAGIETAIAAPATTAGRYRHEGRDVHRFAVDARSCISHAYAEPDEVAARGFRRIVEVVRPSLVHIHARTAAISERLIDIAHNAGARVVFTYHTPTVSCVRGTMMLDGAIPCDGRIERRRCTACALTGHGLSAPASAAIAAVPSALWRVARAFGPTRPPFASAQVPGLIEAFGHGYRRFVAKSDHVVAVCGWVRDVLVTNGVAPEKLTLSRQGIELHNSKASPRAPQAENAALRLAFFGRLGREKGIDLLLDALGLVTNAPVTLDVYAIGTPDHELRSKIARDPRVRLLPPVPPDDVTICMARYDLVAIPSQWLETGPLVVLEAFAAGIPVVGSRLGGIAELVTDGVDGILVTPNDPQAWANAIAQLAGDRQTVTKLAEGVRPPRSARECAADMAALYSSILGQRSHLLSGAA